MTLAVLVFTATSSTINHAKDYSSSGTPRNVIYILTDDQRFDELGFMNPVIDTPHMDQLAKQGVHFKNAFVTTALCSPSRASILTGQYMHSHGVVDNNKPAKDGTIYFPIYLQQAGYQTAFFGKWHMGGHHDDPQPGFDYWLSFAGQGDYYPKRKRNGKMSRFNINGKHVEQKGYITDELTDYTLNWLEHERDKISLSLSIISQSGPQILVPLNAIRRNIAMLKLQCQKAKPILKKIIKASRCGLKTSVIAGTRLTFRTTVN